MHQTLLAVFALSLLSFLVLNTLGDRNENTADRHRALVEDRARAVAVGLIDRASGLPFDGHPTARTARAAFGLPGHLPIPAVLDSAWAGHVGDLDDLDGLGGQATALVADPETGVDRALAFDVALSVEYVAAGAGGWASTADTTGTKRLAVRVREPGTGAEVEIRRILSDTR